MVVQTVQTLASGEPDDEKEPHASSDSDDETACSSSSSSAGLVEFGRGPCDDDSELCFSFLDPGNVGIAAHYFASFFIFGV